MGRSDGRWVPAEEVVIPDWAKAEEALWPGTTGNKLSDHEEDSGCPYCRDLWASSRPRRVCLPAWVCIIRYGWDSWKSNALVWVPDDEVPAVTGESSTP